MSDCPPARRCLLLIGCSSGLGASIARLAHARGIRVVGASSHLSAVDAQYFEQVIECDLRQSDGVERLVADLGGLLDSVRFVVFYSGLAWAGAPLGLSLDEARSMLMVNGVAPGLLLQQQVSASGFNGTYMYISSTAVSKTTPAISVYAMSKRWGEELLERMLGSEGGAGTRLILARIGRTNTGFGFNFPGEVRRRMEDGWPSYRLASILVDHLEGSSAGRVVRLTLPSPK